MLRAKRAGLARVLTAPVCSIVLVLSVLVADGLLATQPARSDADLPPVVPEIRFEGPEPLEIATRGGVRSFDVEVAANDEQRARGLMYRRSLPAGHGMLFDFGVARDVMMWMKNTYVSLDMLFIRTDGVIVNISERTTPLSTATISSAEPVRFVLELPAGSVKLLGIAAGDQVGHRLIGRQ
ncbi:MAG: DUF192 domain-containing protein [Methylacidiphilales bacterium]|nr:DUF192 domain-containing protein [Candidatus Methylacidiphilales bacterium]